jgi:hypothetical protein
VSYMIFGLILGLVLFAVVLLAFYAGYRMGKQSSPVAASEEDKRKAEQLRKGFDALMNYDVSTALKRKKVM